jgi:thioredoxin reductase (NADPH)
VEDVVILGSGPAGLTAAIYTSRADLSTLIIEGKEPGGQIALSHQVDNFPGFPSGINGFELSDQMRQQAVKFGTHFAFSPVVAVDLRTHPFKLFLENGNLIESKALIISSGASPKWLGIPSEKALIGKGVSSCAVCDGFLFKDKEVVVVGGGDTALEDALFLSKYASKVTVIHRSNLLKASKFLQNKAKANQKIHFIFDHTVTEISNPLKNVTITGRSGENQSIPCEGVFVAIGHQPNTKLFKDQIALDESGYIITKPFTTQTNIPGVFAAGDVADSRYRQAITAAGTGCMAGIDAYDYLEKLDSQKEIQ